MSSFLLIQARRLLVQVLIPFFACVLPPAAALFIAWAIPTAAREFYERRVTEIDMLILGLGIPLFLCQVMLSWLSLRRLGTGFAERPFRWLSHLAQAAEWFPLLGLIGTVIGILVTFSSIRGRSSPEEIVQLYARAITATGSGLIMAFINILPLWMVQTGRGLIELVGGGPALESKEMSP